MKNPSPICRNVTLVAGFLLGCFMAKTVTAQGDTLLGLFANLSETQQIAFARGYESVGIAKQFLREAELVDAESEFANGLSIIQQALGADHQIVVDLLMDWGGTLGKQGHHESAIKFLEQARRASKRGLKKQDPTQMVIRSLLADAYEHSGKVADAESVLHDMVAVAKAGWGKESMTHARFLLLAGIKLEALGSSSDAEKCFRDAIAIHGSAKVDAPADLAACHKSLGILLMNRFDIAQAHVEFKRAIDVCKGRRNCDVLMVTTLHAIGSLAQTHGDYATAESNLRLAESHAKQYLSNATNLRGAILGDLGSILALQGKNGGQELLAAFDLMRSDPNHDPEDYAEVLRNLSTEAIRSRMYDTAYQFASESARRLQLLRGRNDPRTGSALYNAGLSAMYLKQTETAESYFKSAIEGLTSSLSPLDARLADMHNGIGTFYAVNGRALQAQHHFDQCQEHSRLRFNAVLPLLTPAEQSQYLFANDIRTQPIWAFVYANSPDQDVVQLGAQWLANHKAIGEDALAAQIQIQQLADGDNPIVRELKRVRESLSRIAFQDPIAHASSDRAARIQQLNEQQNSLVRSLAATENVVAPCPEVRIEQIRSSLPRDTVFVDFMHVTPRVFSKTKNLIDEQQPRYVAWLITSDERDAVKFLDLGKTQVIDALITEITEQMTQDSKPDAILDAGGEVAATKRINQRLSDLGNYILAPMIPHLGNSKHLILAPDGQLWRVPWAALPVEQNKQTVLIEERSLRFVTSARQLVNPRASSLQAKGAMIFADPSFDLGSTPASRILARKRSSIPSPDRAASLRVQLCPATRLPETRDEALNVVRSESLSSLSPIIKLGDQATEAAVKQVQRPQFLGFMTHGFFLASPQIDESERKHKNLTMKQDSVSPMLRSGMLLAGCNNSRSEDQDGFLTGAEVLSLDLRGTQMVYLGACETGLGSIRNAEGVVGLSQAFRLAGARYVAATLWQVDSVETRSLTEYFFKQLGDNFQSPQVALQQAQIEVIQRRRDTYFAAHPYFWAGITLTGN